MKYFKPSEFNCPDGSDMCMSQDFLGFLDLSRDLSGVSYKLNSAYRSVEHNAEVGGKPDSAHTRGLAVDIRTSNSRERYRILVGMIIASLVRTGQISDGSAAMDALTNDVTRFGIDKNFIHVDCDTTKDPEVIWMY
jgi:hypothetical protein